jgi:hypothetical protein
MPSLDNRTWSAAVNGSKQPLDLWWDVSLAHSTMDILSYIDLVAVVSFVKMFELVSRGPDYEFDYLSRISWLRSVKYSKFMLRKCIISSVLYHIYGRFTKWKKKNLVFLNHGLRSDPWLDAKVRSFHSKESIRQDLDNTFWTNPSCRMSCGEFEELNFQSAEQNWEKVEKAIGSNLLNSRNSLY